MRKTRNAFVGKTFMVSFENVCYVELDDLDETRKAYCISINCGQHEKKFSLTDGMQLRAYQDWVASKQDVYIMGEK